MDRLPDPLLRQIRVGIGIEIEKRFVEAELLVRVTKYFGAQQMIAAKLGRTYSPAV